MFSYVRVCACAHLLAAVGGVVGAALAQHVAVARDELQHSPLLQLGEVLGALLVAAPRTERARAAARRHITLERSYKHQLINNIRAG